LCAYVYILIACICKRFNMSVSNVLCVSREQTAACNVGECY